MVIVKVAASLQSDLFVLVATSAIYHRPRSFAWERSGSLDGSI